MRVARTTMAVVLATIGAAAPASAQRWKSIELGTFGEYTRFNDVLELDNAIGLGGMAGLFVLPNLVTEADISFARTNGPLSGDITYRPWRIRAAYHIPVTPQLKIPVGVGYTQGILWLT